MAIALYMIYFFDKSIGCDGKIFAGIVKNLQELNILRFHLFVTRDRIISNKDKIP